MELIDRIKDTCRTLSNPQWHPEDLRARLRALAENIAAYLDLKPNPAAIETAAPHEIPIWDTYAFGNPHTFHGSMTYRQWLIAECAKSPCIVEPDTLPAWPEYHGMRVIELADEILVRMQMERRPDMNEVQIREQLRKGLRRA